MIQIWRRSTKVSSLKEGNGDEESVIPWSNRGFIQAKSITST
ncbi:hypothetical protein [Peribacillus simplex]